MFGGSGVCTACGQTIPADELVMRTSSQINVPIMGGIGNQPNNKNHQTQKTVFHVNCFACSKCGSHLRPGDR